jgi:putative ABC transport system permease protein
MRDRVWALRPDLAVRRSVVFEDFIAESIAPSRFYTGLLAGFAGVALMLALIGIYGTLAYTVTQRAHEVGVRMAIGATAGGVQRMVLRRGLALASAGVVVGLAVALPLTRLLESMVFGVTPTDPPTIVAAVTTIALASVAASLLPARRATRLDPVDVLRNE